MVLNECAEGFFRFFFIFAKFLVVHWGWTITIIIGGVILAQVLNYILEWATVISSLVAGATDLLFDVIKPAEVVGAPAVGLVWVVMLWTSEAWIIMKVLLTPAFFILGLALGLAPDFGVATTVVGLIVAFLLKYKITANISCALLGFVFYLPFLPLLIPVGIVSSLAAAASGLFAYAFGEELCALFNTFSTLFM